MSDKRYTQDEIRAMLAAASPAPWTQRIDELHPDHRLVFSSPEHPVDVASVRPWMGGLGEANAVFIAAAPAIVEQQADRIKELEDEVSGYDVLAEELWERLAEMWNIAKQDHRTMNNLKAIEIVGEMLQDTSIRRKDHDHLPN